MNFAILITEICTLLKEANKNYWLTDEKVKDNPLTVRPGWLPPKATSDSSFYPCIVVRVINSSDTVEGATVTVRCFFGTYCEDLNNAWRELYNLVETSRQALLKKRTIANAFRLDFPINISIEEDQPYPYWVASLDVTYTMAQPQEEINYSEWRENTIWGEEHFPSKHMTQSVKML